MMFEGYALRDLWIVAWVLNQNVICKCTYFKGDVKINK